MVVKNVGLFIVLLLCWSRKVCRKQSMWVEQNGLKSTWVEQWTGSQNVYLWSVIRVWVAWRVNIVHCSSCSTHMLQ